MNATSKPVPITYMRVSTSTIYHVVRNGVVLCGRTYDPDHASVFYTREQPMFDMCKACKKNL